MKLVVGLDKLIAKKAKEKKNEVIRLSGQ